MSIFNLQALESKAKDKKLILEKNKNTITSKIPKDSIPTLENIFVSTIREINDISDKVNANLAYKESLADTTDSQLLRHITVSFMEILTNINANLREKCSAIKESIDMLKERLDSIVSKDDTISTKQIPVDDACTYINLDFIRDSMSAKMLIDNQLSIDTNVAVDIQQFRSYVRKVILGDESEDILDKATYITRLYKMFRNPDTSNSICTMNLEQIYNLVDITSKLPTLFNHDIMSVYSYLNELSRSEDPISDIVAKRIEVILEEYSLLYSARADAIVECTDKTREYISLFVETYGGEEDDE